MELSSVSGKLFLGAGALFVVLVIVLMLLPNEATTDPDASNVVLRTRVYRATTIDVMKAATDVLRTLPAWSQVQVLNETNEITAQRETKFLYTASDVAITVQEGGNEKESEVDVTSISRISLYDFGQNARNIEEFFTTLDQKLQRVQ